MENLKNKELVKLINYQNIIYYVKAQRLSWSGHTNIMPETGTVRKIHKWKTSTARPVGTPKSRWEDVRKDMRKVKLIKWTEQV